MERPFYSFKEKGLLFLAFVAFLLFFLPPFFSFIGFLLVELFVPVLEAIDATGRIDQVHLSGIERVRSIGDLNLHQRILIAVLPLDGLVRRGGGTGDERIPIGHILKNDVAVLFRMDPLFHGFGSFCYCKFNRIMEFPPLPKEALLEFRIIKKEFRQVLDLTEHFFIFASSTELSEKENAWEPSPRCLQCGP